MLLALQHLMSAEFSWERQNQFCGHLQMLKGDLKGGSKRERAERVLWRCVRRKLTGELQRKLEGELQEQWYAQQNLVRS